MQAAQHAAAGSAVIVLHEAHPRPEQFLVAVLAPGLDEEATGIPVDLGAHQDDAVQFRAFEYHGPGSTSPAR